MTMDTNKNYGGKRNGAGRPRKGKELRVSMSLSVDPSIMRKAQELRKDGVDVNSLVCHIIAVEYERKYGESDTRKMDEASERYLHEPE